MPREFERSEMTNQVFDLLTKKHRMGITLDIPEVGLVRLRGDTLREFIWTVRSHKADTLLERFLKQLKENVKAARESLEARD